MIAVQKIPGGHTPLAVFAPLRIIQHGSKFPATVSIVIRDTPYEPNGCPSFQFSPYSIPCTASGTEGIRSAFGQLNGTVFTALMLAKSGDTDTRVQASKATLPYLLDREVGMLSMSPLLYYVVSLPRVDPRAFV